MRNLESRVAAARESQVVLTPDEAGIWETLLHHVRAAILGCVVDNDYLELVGRHLRALLNGSKAGFEQVAYIPTDDDDRQSKRGFGGGCQRGLAGCTRAWVRKTRDVIIQIDIVLF